MSTVFYTSNAAQTCPTLQPVAHWFARYRHALAARSGLTLPTTARYSCAATSNAAEFCARLDALSRLAADLATVAEGVACGDYETDPHADRFSHCADIHARMARRAACVSEVASAARRHADEATRAGYAANALAAVLTHSAHAAECAVWVADETGALIRIAPLSDAERAVALLAVARLLHAYLPSAERV
ncbi:hypothetical protein PQR37_10575 [Paraburkholderia nemoris]|uniref:hypothetical protein n=1 Tax=Paraburkholderia nemoris TaxID=2793076 RepID=UPI0038BDEC31